MNKVELIGMVGNEPELKQTPNGKSYVNLRVGTKERAPKNADGTRGEAPFDWHNVIVWGILAETVFKYVHKGDKLFIEGRIQYRKYTDKQGTERYVTDIVCNDVEFLFNRVYQNPGQGQQPQTGYQQQRYPQQQPQQAPVYTNQQVTPAQPQPQNNEPQETLPF